MHDDMTIQMKARLFGAICFSKFRKNEIWKFGRNLLLAKFGSERVKQTFFNGKQRNILYTYIP